MSKSESSSRLPRKQVYQTRKFREKIEKATDLIATVTHSMGRDWSSEVITAIKDSLEIDESAAWVRRTEDGTEVMSTSGVFRLLFEYFEFDRRDQRAQETVFQMVKDRVDKIAGFSEDGPVFKKRRPRR